MHKVKHAILLPLWYFNILPNPPGATALAVAAGINESLEIVSGGGTEQCASSRRDGGVAGGGGGGVHLVASWPYGGVLPGLPWGWVAKVGDSGGGARPSASWLCCSALPAEWGTDLAKLHRLPWG